MSHNLGKLGHQQGAEAAEISKKLFWQQCNFVAVERSGTSLSKHEQARYYTRLI